MILAVYQLQRRQQIGLRPNIGGSVAEKRSRHNAAGLRRGIVGVNADAQDKDKNGYDDFHCAALFDFGVAIVSPSTRTADRIGMKCVCSFLSVPQ